jgi:hypothetical protein
MGMKEMGIKTSLETQGFKLIEPQGPDLLPVFRMHRGMPDSYIGFYTKNPKAHERVWGTALNKKGHPRYQLIGVRSDAIPIFMPLGLERDAYHTINGIHPPWQKDSRNLIASAYRRKDGVKYLNAS